MGERRCTTLMTLNLISTDRSGGPLSRSGRGAVLVNSVSLIAILYAFNGAVGRTVVTALIDH